MVSESVSRACETPVVRMRAVISVAAMVVLSGCTWPGAAPSTVTATAAMMRVTSVSDGDTFTAVSAEGERVRIRLLGIDAPEAARDGQPAQCGADQATEAMQRLIAGRSVGVTSDPAADSVDRFGRQLAYVSVDGRDVALALVQQGMAEAWYPASEPEPTRYAAYRAAGRGANAANTGLWAVCDSVGR